MNNSTFCKLFVTLLLATFFIPVNNLVFAVAESTNFIEKEPGVTSKCGVLPGIDVIQKNEGSESFVVMVQNTNCWNLKCVSNFMGTRVKIGYTDGANFQLISDVNLEFGPNFVGDGSNLAAHCNFAISSALQNDDPGRRYIVIDTRHHTIEQGRMSPAEARQFF